jgi:MoxR-like ATPase
MAGADTVGGSSVEKLEDVIVRSAEQVSGQIRAAKDAISTVIFGQDRVIENTLVTILSGGHALLIGVPGLAKTKLVETLGITLGLDAKRIQFTPDLMPSDILGAEVLDESSTGKRSFRFISGPVFAQLLMADEINRASPRTQSALLQAMRRLSRSRRRAPHPVRNHRRRRDASQGGDELRHPDYRATTGAAAAGRRLRGRGDPFAGALGASGR